MSDDLFDVFVEENETENVQPVSAYKVPNKM